MWTKRSEWAVGGFREMGFFPQTDHLLVLSGNGRGIFDCLTHEKVARDYADYYMEKWDDITGVVEGFGTFEGQIAICGGFEYPSVLQHQTQDGWHITVRPEMRENWQKEQVPMAIMYLTHDATE